MSYDIGTYIDLTHINRKMVEKKSAHEKAQHYYSIGTSFLFRITPEGYKAARVIPVAFA